MKTTKLFLVRVIKSKVEIYFSLLFCIYFISVFLHINIYLKTILAETFVSCNVAFSSEMCFFKVKALQGQT